MKRCSAKPYEGVEKYIFISYCHKDRVYVFPIIEQLAKEGYRVWYDEGIDPGSEWPEIIASHLNAAAVCIAFISENSLNSHNCRREINFALLKKKFFVSVILEPVQMSLGMEMQLSSSQSIFKYTLSSDKEFFSKLYDAKKLECCKGNPNYSIEVSTVNDYLNDSSVSKMTRSEPFSDRWFAQGDNVILNIHKTDDECDGGKIIVQSVSNDEDCESKKNILKVDEEAELSTEKSGGNEEISNSNYKKRHILKYKKTEELVVINKSPFNIGRLNGANDYVIVDNRSISRKHAFFVISNDICYITDNYSLNKTFVNDAEIAPGVEYALNSGDVISFCNEHFVYLLEEI